MTGANVFSKSKKMLSKCRDFEFYKQRTKSYTLGNVSVTISYNIILLHIERVKSEVLVSYRYDIVSIDEDRNKKIRICVI